jgi:hypothetical protein
MIGVAEVDELLALGVDRHEGHVKDAACGSGLDFAGGEIGHEFERRANFLRERIAQVDGDAAVAARRRRILECVERRRRRPIGNRHAQLARRRELLDRGTVLSDGLCRHRRNECSEQSEIPHGGFPLALYPPSHRSWMAVSAGRAHSARGESRLL